MRSASSAAPPPIWTQAVPTMLQRRRISSDSCSNSSTSSNPERPLLKYPQLSQLPAQPTTEPSPRRQPIAPPLTKPKPAATQNVTAQRTPKHNHAQPLSPPLSPRTTSGGGGRSEFPVPSSPPCNSAEPLPFESPTIFRKTNPKKLKTSTSVDSMVLPPIPDRRSSRDVSKMVPPTPNGWGQTSKLDNQYEIEDGESMSTKPRHAGVAVFPSGSTVLPRAK